MARISFDGYKQFGLQLEALSSADSQKICGHAIHEGAGIVADEIRKNIEALPEENFRYLDEGEKFDGVPPEHKESLLDSLGISGMSDNCGFLGVKIGFDGFGYGVTNTYPDGLPNQLLAGAIESGSSVREKHPFVRPAVNAKRKEVIETMRKIVNEDIKAIMEGNGK